MTVALFLTITDLPIGSNIFGLRLRQLPAVIARKVESWNSTASRHRPLDARQQVMDRKSRLPRPGRRMRTPYSGSAVTNGQQTQALIMGLAMAAPVTVDWCGYWQKSQR